MRLLVVGYYGHRNFGDDLLMKVVLDRVTNAPGLGEVAATCAADGADYVGRWYPSVRLVDAARAARLYRRYDRVLFGGGGTVFDYRDHLALGYCLRKLASNWLTMGLARWAGTRFAAVGLGLGPFHSRRGRDLAMIWLRYLDRVYVRDARSLRYARSAVGERARRGDDLCWAACDEVRALAAAPRRDGEVVFVVRHYRYGPHGDAYLEALLAAADALAREGKHVLWAAYQGPYDEEVVQRLRGAGRDVWVWDPARAGVDEACGILAGAECVVSARMHAVYLAGMMGVPAVAVELHPKLRYAAQAFGGLAATVPAAPTAAEVLDACRAVTGAASPAPAEDAGIIRDRTNETLEEVCRWASGA